jgi:hypothetical protein
VQGEAVQVEAPAPECMPRRAEVEAVPACSPLHSIAAKLLDREAGECLLRTLPRQLLKWGCNITRFDRDTEDYDQ